MEERGDPTRLTISEFIDKEMAMHPGGLRSCTWVDGACGAATHMLTRRLALKERFRCY